ncbi:hypothetical protein AB0D94_07415 [Streptomyces sp. NPDC048255]|uniref:hypothetical protein n=1 Tax=Streptomyces sp. NPDC048255 TaxID=3154713 RepID=UPI0033FFA154
MTIAQDEKRRRRREWLTRGAAAVALAAVLCGLAAPDVLAAPPGAPGSPVSVTPLHEDTPQAVRALCAQAVESLAIR